MKKIYIECCIESYKEAVSAEKKGADQIEVCSDLCYDGLTPNFQLVEKIKDNLSIPIKVMVRPRRGDFCYSNSDMKKIQSQISVFKSIGIKHIACGVLNKNSMVNIDSFKKIGDWSYPMKITFHKAIDESVDFFNDIEALLQTGRLDSLLTSGQSKSAEKGAKTIKKAINKFDDNIKVISAGKILYSNLYDIHQKIGGRYYHGRKILGNLI